MTTTLRVRELIDALRQLPPDDPIWAVGWYRGATRVWEIDGAVMRNGVGAMPSPQAQLLLADDNSPRE